MQGQPGHPGSSAVIRTAKSPPCSFLTPPPWCKRARKAVADPARSMEGAMSSHGTPFATSCDELPLRIRTNALFPRAVHTIQVRVNERAGRLVTWSPREASIIDCGGRTRPGTARRLAPGRAMVELSGLVARLGNSSQVEEGRDLRLLWQRAGRPLTAATESPRMQQEVDRREFHSETRYQSKCTDQSVAPRGACCCSSFVARKRVTCLESGVSFEKRQSCRVPSIRVRGLSP